MVDHNVATNGAHQSSIGAEFSLIKVSVHQEGGSSATIAITQRLGSPLFIRPSYQPLTTLLQSSENTELQPNHFNGRNVYTERAATFVDSNGSMVQTLMSTHMRDNKHMEPDWLGTVIICLSVFMSKIELADILTRALLIYAHGCVEPQLRGDFGILRSVIDKYAATVLSLDSMCDKLKITKQSVQAKVYQKCPGLAWYEMFSPPRSRSEREDFIELLFQILSAPTGNTNIYTRSVKLLGLANLLAHYGWQIDILAQEEYDVPPVAVDVQQGALTVIYSLDESMNDHFIEAHARRGSHLKFDMPGASFYPSISSKAEQWGNGTALYFSTGQLEEESFLRGYEKVKTAWDKSVRLLTTTLHQGQLLAWAEIDSWTFNVERTGTRHDRFKLMSKFAHVLLKRIPIVEAIVDIASNVHATLDWERLEGATQERREESSTGSSSSTQRLSIVVLLQFLLDSMSTAQGLTRSSITGGILAILDSIIEALVRIPADCLIRVPVGDSIERFVRIASEYGKTLFDSQHGLKISDAVILCTARLAGVNPKDPRIAKTTVPEDIIGFWNGQQGILLTPVWERSLLCDLPEGHRLPLTLHNRPILGIPTDSGGWIKAGTAELPYDRQIKRFTSVRPAHSKIILQYRAHFEVDSTELVAAVYINGVFFNLLSVKQALGYYSPPDFYESGSCCKHSISEQSAPPPQSKYISLRNLDAGVRIVPDKTCDCSVIISPHGSSTSRLFAYLLYSDKDPVVQDGCFKCALLQADGNGSIVISRLESEAAARPA